ncbi:hypothetical protein TcWFU_007637 [Taenia crassiceps]|uniref:Uncharacterized protein n=1 Tax=Taenia crassiceps TaxID=6207 RepID=A0ABR4QHW0_9CEST
MRRGKREKYRDTDDGRTPGRATQRCFVCLHRLAVVADKGGCGTGEEEEEGDAGWQHLTMHPSSNHSLRDLVSVRRLVIDRELKYRPTSISPPVIAASNHQKERRNNCKFGLVLFQVLARKKGAERKDARDKAKRANEVMLLSIKEEKKETQKHTSPLSPPPPSRTSINDGEGKTRQEGAEEGLEECYLMAAAKRLL